MPQLGTEGSAVAGLPIQAAFQAANILQSRDLQEEQFRIAQLEALKDRIFKDFLRKKQEDQAQRQFEQQLVSQGIGAAAGFGQAGILANALKTPALAAASQAAGPAGFAGSAAAGSGAALVPGSTAFAPPIPPGV